MRVPRRPDLQPCRPDWALCAVWGIVGFGAGLSLALVIAWLVLAAPMR